MARIRNHRQLESARRLPPLPGAKPRLGGVRNPDDPQDPGYGIAVPGTPASSRTNELNPGHPKKGTVTTTTSDGKTTTTQTGTTTSTSGRPSTWTRATVDGHQLWYDAATGNYYDNAGNLVWSPTGATGGDGGGGGSGGDGSGTKKDDAPFIDWGSALSGFGVPKDLIDKIIKEFGQDTDPNRAISRALAFVRGSKWYADTFPGISHGIKAGLFASSMPEVEYRQWLSQVQQTWKRYSSMGGTLDKSDIELWLGQGFSPDTIERRFQGRAFAQTHGADLQYATGAFDTAGRFTGDDVTELGFHQAGLSSAKGASLADRVAKAQARMQRVFEGVLATPMFEQRGRGIAAASLQSQRGRPDIGA